MTTTAEPGSAFVTLDEAADYFRVSTRTVRRMISSGDLPAVRIGKRQIRIARYDLDICMTPIATGEVPA